MMTAQEIPDVLPQELSNAVITDIHIAEIATHICNWEELAPFLSLSPAEEEEIKNDFQGRYSLQKREALRKWKERMGSKATYSALVEVFSSRKKEQLAMKLKDLIIPTEGGHRKLSVLNTFETYLKDCYVEMPHPAQHQWPSGLYTPCYVDLSLHDIPINPPTTPQTTQAKINKPIDFGKIFTTRSFKAKRNVVLMEGVAGSGKTTLSWHACQKWAEGELFQQFDLLIHVSLADPCVHVAMSLADLIPHPSSEVREAVAKAIAEQHGKRVCFLFDGADELPPSALQRQSFLYKLIAGTGPRSTLSHCSILLTSRPEQACKLQSLVTARLLLKGFEEKQLSDFLKGTLQANTKTLQQIQKAFEINPNLASLCSLPINAAIMAQYFDFFKDNLPSTQSELFHGLISNFLVRHIQLRTTEEGQPVTDFNGLPPSVLEKFKALCALAYKAIDENKQIFGADILKPLNLSFPVDALGLLEVHQQLTMFGPEQYYTFPHLAIQEFLAAVHMSYMSEEEQTKAVKEILKRNPLSQVLPFYAGITGLFNTSVQKQLLKVCKCHMDPLSVFSRMAENPFNDSRRLFIALSNCIYEAQQGELCKQIVFPKMHDQLNMPLVVAQVSLINLQLLPTDCISIGYIARHLSRSSTDQTIQQYAFWLGESVLSDTSIAALLHQLKQDPKHQGKQLALALCGIHLSNNSMRRLRSFLQGRSNVDKPLIQRCSFEDVFFGLKCLIEGLSCGRCSYIELTRCGLNDAHIYHLCYLIGRCNLEEVCFSANDFSKVIPLLSAAIAIAPCLRSLRLSECNITDEGLKHLGRVVCNSTSLNQMNIAKNLFSEDALTYFLKLFVDKPQSCLCTLMPGRQLSCSQWDIVYDINTSRSQTCNLNALICVNTTPHIEIYAHALADNQASIPPKNLSDR